MRSGISKCIQNQSINTKKFIMRRQIATQSGWKLGVGKILKDGLTKRDIDLDNTGKSLGIKK